MRALWSGSLSFGLVNIPVQLYSASKERAVKFTMLDKHGNAPIAYLRVRRGTHEEVPYENIVRGYEYKKGDYVVLTDEDIEKATPRKSRTIDIVHFSDVKDIEPKYFHKPYYIEPDKRAEKAYVLLREALKRSGKAAIAKFVLREREHLAAITVDGKALMLHQLRFQDEIRPPEGLRIPGNVKHTERELEIALSLIEKLEAHFKAAEHEDEYADTLKRVIAAKKRGGKKAVVHLEKAPEKSDMRDLMQLLRKSLEKEHKARVTSRGHGSRKVSKKARVR